jgi:hypothetical protein
LRLQEFFSRILHIPDLKIPAVFLIDKKGNIIFEIIGEKPDSIKKLEEKLKTL